MKKKNYQELIRKRYKGKATFRIAPGSDNPYNPAVERLIVSTKDDKVYKQLKKIEEKLKKMFNVEIVMFR